MSGGRRIEDHSFFAGKGDKNSPLPKGVHTKHYSSAEGAGHLATYEDTSEAIHSIQLHAKEKVKAHKSNPQKRN